MTAPVLRLPLFNETSAILAGYSVQLGPRDAGSGILLAQPSGILPHTVQRQFVEKLSRKFLLALRIWGLDSFLQQFDSTRIRVNSGLDGRDGKAEMPSLESTLPIAPAEGGAHLVLTCTPFLE